MIIADETSALARWKGILRAVRRDGMPALFLIGATALFFWPLWIAGYRFPKGGGDLWGQLYPVWSFVAEELGRGVLPLWNPRMLGGDPIFSEGQYGLFNPLNWPLFLASPIPPGWVLLRGAFSLWLAGVGMYVYLRRSPIWRLGRSAALTGALAYMFSDPFVVHLGHPQFNDAMAWLPWALAGVDQAARRTRRIPLGALPIALLLLSGHGQAALYGMLTVGLYALGQAAAGGWPQGFYRIGRLALAGLLGIALAAPSLLPGLERLPLTDRAGVPFEQRRGYEFPPAMLIDLLSPLFHGRGADQFWLPANRVESGYVGSVTLYLALLGLLGTLRFRRTWALIGLGTLALLFSLGYQGPLYPALARLPLFSETWKTARAIYLVSFALAIAGAMGVEQLRRSRPRTLILWALALSMGGLVLWGIAPRWAAEAPEGPARARAVTGLRFAAFLAWGTALSGWAISQGRTWLRPALPLLLTAELVALGATAEAEPSPPHRDPHPQALRFLRADPGWFRVDVDPAARDLWPPIALQMAGFEVPQGTGNPMELREFNILRWWIPSATHPAYRMLGVKYIVVPKGAPPGGEGIWPVFVDDPAIDIHLHTGALPRVWLVYRTEIVDHYGEALKRVLDERFRPEEIAVVQNGPRLNGEGRGRIGVARYSPNEVILDVETDAPALLVLSDTFYPGWQATVDGLHVPIYRTNAVFRGVEVPPGRHRVTLRFRPGSLRIGLGMAMAGGLMGLVLGVAGKRSR